MAIAAPGATEALRLAVTPCVLLVVPGEPTGKGRPRFNRATGNAYTPADTLTAEQRIQGEWIAAGRLRLPDGPLSLDVDAVLVRPQGHWRRDGQLSASGLRATHPTKRPDWDNLGKLIADALNGMAYRDDSQIVQARLVKRWANAQEPAHTRIEIRPLPG